MQAILDLSAEVAPLVGEAVSERVIDAGYSFMADVGDHLDRASGIVRAATIPLDRLRAYLVKEKLPVLLKLQGEQVDSFLAIATETTQEAMASGWTRAEYVAEIERLANLYGALGFQSPYAEVWYNTYVLNAAYNEAQMELLLNTSAGRLFPFVRIRTQRDERVRASHRQVDNLTARPTWPGWARFTPPLDWNCRCLLEKIGWRMARLLDLENRIPWGSAVVIR